MGSKSGGGGGLAFDITADNSTFLEALKEADKAQSQFAGSVAASMDTAAGQAEGVWSRIGGAIKGVAGDINTALEGGAEKTEAMLTSGIDKAKQATQDWLDGIVHSLTSKLGKLGPLLDGAWNVGKVGIASGFDLLLEKGAELAKTKWVDTGELDRFAKGLDEASLKTKGFGEYLSEVGSAFSRGWSSGGDSTIGKIQGAFSEATSVSLERTQDELRALGDEAERTGGKFSEVAKGANSYINTILYNTLSLGEMKALDEMMDRQIEKQKRVIDLIGKSVEERARMQARAATRA